MIGEMMSIYSKTPFSERGAAERIMGVFEILPMGFLVVSLLCLQPPTYCQGAGRGATLIANQAVQAANPPAPARTMDEEFVVRTFNVSGLSFDQVAAMTGSFLSEEGAFELVRKINALVVRDRLPGIMRVERFLDSMKDGNRDRKQVMVMSTLVDDSTGTVLARPSFAMTEGFSGSYTRTSNIGIAEGEGKYRNLDTGLVIDMIPQSVSGGLVTLKIGTTFSGIEKAGSPEAVKTVRQETVVKIAQREESVLRIKNPVSDKKDLIFRFFVSIL